MGIRLARGKRFGAKSFYRILSARKLEKKQKKKIARSKGRKSSRRAIIKPIEEFNSLYLTPLFKLNEINR